MYVERARVHALAREKIPCVRSGIVTYFDTLCSRCCVVAKLKNGEKVEWDVAHVSWTRYNKMIRNHDATTRGNLSTLSA